MDVLVWLMKLKMTNEQSKELFGDKAEEIEKQILEAMGVLKPKEDNN